MKLQSALKQTILMTLGMVQAVFAQYLRLEVYVALSEGRSENKHGHIINWK